MKRFFKYHPDSLENNRNDKWRKIVGILLASLTAGTVFLLLSCVHIAFLFPTNIDRLYVTSWDPQYFTVIYLIMAFTSVFCGIFTLADFVVNRPRKAFLNCSKSRKKTFNNFRFFFWGFIHFASSVSLMVLVFTQLDEFRIVSSDSVNHAWIIGLLIVFFICLLGARMLNTIFNSNAWKTRCRNFIIVPISAAILLLFPIYDFSSIEQLIEEEEFVVSELMELPQSFQSKLRHKMRSWPTLLFFKINDRLESDTIGIVFDQQVVEFEELWRKVYDWREEWEGLSSYRQPPLTIMVDGRLRMQTLFILFDELETLFPNKLNFTTVPVAGSYLKGHHLLYVDRYTYFRYDLGVLDSCLGIDAYEWYDPSDKPPPPPRLPQSWPARIEIDDNFGLKVLYNAGWENCLELNLRAGGVVSYGEREGSLKELDQLISMIEVHSEKHNKGFCVSHLKVSVDATWADFILLKSKLSKTKQTHVEKRAQELYGKSWSELEVDERYSIFEDYKLGSTFIYCPETTVIVPSPI